MSSSSKAEPGNFHERQPRGVGLEQMKTSVQKGIGRARVATLDVVPPLANQYDSLRDDSAPLPAAPERITPAKRGSLVSNKI